MRICKTCEHCIFDEQWGEYKCKKHQHRIYNPMQIGACKGYSQKKKKEKEEKKDG